VVIWEFDRHQQLQPKGSAAEKGCTITHTVIASRLAAGGGSQQGAAVAYYAISTPGSGTVTIKWLDGQGRSGVVQVGWQKQADMMGSSCSNSSFLLHCDW
jgi:hypothetical protein